MEYLSVNNKEYKIAAYLKGTDVIESIEDSEHTSNSTSRIDLNQVLVPPIEGEDLKTPAQSVIPSMLWLGTILTSFVIWIVCIISLVLNIIRKNTGKAIFSGIAFIIPIIDIILATMGRATETSLVTIFAFLIQMIVLIIVFIFCFSKNKNVTNQSNKQQ